MSTTITNAATVNIIPAQPGYKILYGQDDGLFVAEDVIAWRIETRKDGGEYISTVKPLAPDGEPGADWLGLLHPDGSVYCMDALFPSLKKANKARRKLAERAN